MLINELTYKMECLQDGDGVLEYTPIFKSFIVRQASFLSVIYNNIQSADYNHFLNKTLNCDHLNNTFDIFYLMLLHPKYIDYYLNEFITNGVKIQLSNKREWQNFLYGYIDFIKIDQKTEDELDPIIRLLDFIHHKCPVPLEPLDDNSNPLAIIYNYFIRKKLCEDSYKDGDHPLLEYIFQMSCIGVHMNWEEKVQSNISKEYKEIEIYVG